MIDYEMAVSAIQSISDALQQNNYCRDIGFYYDPRWECYIRARRPFRFNASFASPIGLPWVVYVPTKGTKPQKWAFDEPLLCDTLISENHLHHINGRFVNEDGVLSDNEVMSMVTARIEPFMDTKLSAQARSIFLLLQAKAYCPPPPLQKRSVFLRGGTILKFKDDGCFDVIQDRDAITLNRLPVVYDPNATCPIFNKYISELLQPEDIITVKEFCGYCLLQTTEAQKALFIRGEGGNGKTVLLSTMSALFGKSSTIGKLPQLETNRFKVATLENKLLFMDDDLNTALLSETGNLKTLITAQNPQQAQRKGKDSFEFTPYARILAVGNTFIGAMHDRSNGFYRRLILIECKPVPSNRVDDVTLPTRIIDNELSGFLNWCIEGLQLLLRSNMRFHISDQSQRMIEEKQLADNPAKMFMQDDDWIVYDSDLEKMNGQYNYVSSENLLSAFHVWCKLNAVDAPVDKTAQVEFSAEAKRHGASLGNYRFNGTKKRGYKGMKLSSTAESKTIQTQYDHILHRNG